MIICKYELCHLTQLRRLYAQNNLMRYLHSTSAFKSLEVLSIMPFSIPTYLYLHFCFDVFKYVSNNSLTCFTNTQDMPNMRIFEAKSNRIAQFPTFEMHKVELLDLSFNKIMYLIYLSFLTTFRLFDQHEGHSQLRNIAPLDTSICPTMQSKLFLPQFPV